MASSNEIIVGVDIGATYSKVAFIGPDQRRILCTFGPPASKAGKDDKLSDTPFVVPTALYYNCSGVLVGWGYDTVPGAKRLRHFKQSMLHEDDWHADARTWSVLTESVKTRNDLQMKAVDTWATYIGQLWDVCKEQILKGQETGMNELTFRWIVTLPASWPHHRFQEAFDKSVLSSLRSNDPVMFLTEAEAAVDTVLDLLGGEQLHDVDVQVGDYIMVVDCGGLTIDTICGVMTSGENMLGFKPITTPSSELCGASVMTDIFVNMLQDKVKSILNGSVSFDEHYCDKLARNWETNIMRRFRRGVSKTWTFPLPEDSLEAGTSRATYARWRQNQGLQLFSQEVASILDFAVNGIAGAVQTQAEDMFRRTKKRPKYVFVTGGFSLNEYVRAQLQESLEVVILPKNIAWTAVARGAAIRGQKVAQSLASLETYIAPETYIIEAGGYSATILSKGEYMMHGSLKRVQIPWMGIMAVSNSADGIVRLRMGRIVDLLSFQNVLEWRPTSPVKPGDEVSLEMRWKAGGSVDEWALWHNKKRHEVTLKSLGAS